MRFFIAGIMQGSHVGRTLHQQQYRRRLKERLLRHFPGADVYDPLADHADSIDYDDGKGKEVFFRHNRMCQEVDVVIAYVPEASMGTAIEMWQAHQHGRGVVITISPLSHNWAVRFCSDQVYADIQSFEAALESGELQQLIEVVRKDRRSCQIGP